MHGITLVAQCLLGKPLRVTTLSGPFRARIPVRVQCYSFDAERLTAEAESPTVTCRQKANHRRWTVDSTAKSAAAPSTMKSAMYLQHRAHHWGARQRRAEQLGSKHSLKFPPRKKPIFLMTIDDKILSFSFAFVRSDAILAFCFCERSLRSCKRLQKHTNASETGSAVSTPSVGTILEAP